MLPQMQKLKKFSQFMRNRRITNLFIAFILLLYIIYLFFGIGVNTHTKSFEENFDYPLNINIKPLMKQVLAGSKLQVQPINYYPYKYLTNSKKCRTAEELDLFIVVKSAMDHFDNRIAIRQTYGQESVTPGQIIKTIFFLGVEGQKTDTQINIEAEREQFKDIIQMDFIDTFFNNTIKTMMTFRWLFEHCSNAEFYLFTDDDMYISIPNLFKYLTTVKTVDGSPITAKDDFYSGYTLLPQRIVVNKWRDNFNEYPWDKWPHCVTTGAYVVSNRSMKELYVASLFVKHFRFDDIYLGIVAKKAGIVPTHCDRFYFYKKPYSMAGYRDVIASHGYGNREVLLSIWNEQHSLY